MKQLLILILALTLLLSLSGGCGGGKTLKEVNNSELPDTVPLPEKAMIDRRAYNHFVNGSIFEVIGEYYLANQQYREALQLYPESQEIRYTYAASSFRLRDFENALAAALELYPRDKRAWLLLADCYRVLDSVKQALGAYQNAAELDSTNPQIYYHIANYFQRLEQLDSAAVAFERIATLSPGADTYQQLGSLQVRAGMIEKARGNFHKSIALDSGRRNLRSYLGLIMIYENQGERQKARQYLETAAAHAPNDVLIQTRLLGYYEEDRELDKAIDIARKIIPLAPLDNNIVRRLGILYYAADSLRLADSIFTGLLENGTGNAVNLFYAGRIALQLNDYERAKRHFIRVTAVADSVVDGWLNLGLVFRLQDSIEIEIATYRDGLQYMPDAEDSIVLLFPLGAALERNSQFDSSVETFELILSARPEHAPALNYLGYMLADRGVRLKEARHMIEKALSIDPDNAAYIDSYGWVLFKLGRYRQALDQLQKAGEQIDDDPVVMEHLGDAYEAIGDIDNALLYWNRTLELDPGNESVREKLRR
ncbi:MAG: tetratricopeptide repeat protein [Candidatus Zixiibacteriota bacterium]|nr:MAG: tetratricopeptide repeat protein [candidate division Zixibacteria bacterium]